jgi:hypothetical protein
MSFAKKFLHFHIAKTAGKSLERLFRDHADEVLNFRARQPNRDQLAFLERINQAPPDIITGHLSGASARVRREMGKEKIFVTIVRNPLDRFVSFYNYCRTRPASALQKVFQNLDIDGAFEYSLETKSDFVRNSQCGSVIWGRHEKINFTNAKAVLDEHYLLCAPIERLDDFVATLFRTGLLNGAEAKIAHVNVSTKNGALSKANATKLMELTEEDSRLHEYLVSSGLVGSRCC